MDGSGRRVARHVDGQQTHGFLYGQNTGPEAELDAQGQVRSRFIYATDTRVPDLMLRDGRTYRILTDHLTSPRLIIDTDTGAVAQRIDYDPLGQITQDTNPGFQPFGYGGGLHDPDTGLVRHGARDYDPHTGRWTSKDPIDFAGGDPNLYAHASNDPINHIDPGGLLSLPNPKDAAKSTFGAVSDAWDATRQAGNDAQAFWADLATDPGSSFAERLSGNALGSLASLWTCETATKTALTLGPAGTTLLGLRTLARFAGGRRGTEIRSRSVGPGGGPNWRIAPFGNKGGKKGERLAKGLPHYHRRGPGGVKRHRPWQRKPGDGRFWDRF